MARKKKADESGDDAPKVKKPRAAKPAAAKVKKPKKAKRRAAAPATPGAWWAGTGWRHPETGAPCSPPPRETD